MVCAISEDLGLEHYLLHPKSILSPEYIKFLEQLPEKYFHEPLVIFMDNLMVHRTNEVKAVYKRLNITPVYNVPYSPQYNGIESYFSILKNYYKKQLLNRLTTDSDVDANKLIREALKAVDDKKAMACARFGRETIEK